MLGSVFFAGDDCRFAGRSKSYTLKLRTVGDITGLSLVDIFSPLRLAVLVLFCTA